MHDLYLGIDTSNYKTSVAVTDSGNSIIYRESLLLDVPAGKRGLRQSDAFFMHSCRLPEMFERLCSEIDISSIVAAGVSDRPRRVEGSYMPCFLAGVNAAREIAAAAGIPLYMFSHQEGHAAAIMEDPDFAPASQDNSRKALFFHLSGGTTEFLVCSKDDHGYDMKLAGATRDISIGQLIDRAGVAMGLPFPAGSYIDDMACGFISSGSRPDRTKMKSVHVKDGYFNLSGPETALMKLIDRSEPESYPEISALLLARMAELLEESAVSLSESFEADTVIMAGGVASSKYIRSLLREYTGSRTSTRPAAEIVFGDPSLSGDNAVGIARLARRMREMK